jgi:hypothetical protein
MEEGYDAVNVERARLLLRGEALPELPPEAFPLRGSRAGTAAPTTTPAAAEPAPDSGRSVRRRAAVGSPGA